MIFIIISLIIKLVLEMVILGNKSKSRQTLYATKPNEWN